MGVAPMSLDVPAGVQDFNFWAILIMARLWEEFPRPQYFIARPSVVTVTSDSALAGEKFGPEGQIQAFRDTMNWLLAEGFLRGMDNAAGAYAAVSLTTRGFTVLNQVPHSIDSPPATPQKPLGALMREAGVSHGVGVIAALVQTMLTPRP
jgi:hypothetical protein